MKPPEGVPERAWLQIARPEGDRWAIDERNAAGEIVGTAYRRPDGSKSFERGGKRGLIVDWPLDNYAGTSRNEPIFVCEGASDTAALLGLGLDAVGLPMTGTCGSELAELVSGRHVAIVTDADTAGRRGASIVATDIHQNASSIRMIEPPDEAKDARAAVIAGADAEEFRCLADEAQDWKPAPAAPAGDPDWQPKIVVMSDVQAAEVDWLWPGRIAVGCLTVVVGKPGEGKSLLMADLAARVSAGLPFPDAAVGQLGSVVLLSAEDDPAATIRPRLEAAGADLNRIALLEGRCRRGQDEADAAPITLDQVGVIEETLATVDSPKLLIIDPIGS